MVVLFKSGMVRTEGHGEVRGLSCITASCTDRCLLVLQSVTTTRHELTQCCCVMRYVRHYCAADTAAVPPSACNVGAMMMRALGISDDVLPDTWLLISSMVVKQDAKCSCGNFTASISLSA